MRSKFLAVLLLGALTATGSAVQPERERPAFSVTSTRALVEFIAVDEKGRVVKDLTLGDIEVSVDGKKQDVDFLLPPGENFGSTDYVTARQLANRDSGGGPSAELEGGGSTLRTAIVLDTRVLDASNFAHSVDAIRRFIEESLEADSLVMLAEIDRGLKIASPFSRDKAALLAALDKLQPATVYNPLDRNRLLGNLGSQYFDDLYKQVGYLREGLTQLCYALSGSPGRKHIVFFSEGYPVNPIKELELDSRQSTALGSADSRQQASRTVASRKDPGVLAMVQEVVSLANSFSINFYSVDARGLVAVAGGGPADVGDRDLDNPAPDGQARRVGDAGPAGDPFDVKMSNFSLTRLSSLDDAQDTLVALSAGTNGSAFVHSNDLGAVLRASTNEPKLKYLASFVPKLKGKPKFRRLDVKSKRKGVVIRSQIGFTDFPKEQLLNLQLAAALREPEDFRALEPLLEFETAPGGGQAVIGVEGAKIGARRQDGKYHIEVLFVGQIFDQNGKAVSDQYAIQRGFQADLTQEQFQSLAFQPLKAREELKLGPGKYRVVLAVVDGVAGALGSTVREISVP